VRTASQPGRRSVAPHPTLGLALAVSFAQAINSFSSDALLAVGLAVTTLSRINCTPTSPGDFEILNSQALGFLRVINLHANALFWNS
jgi:hypothetical protein